MAKVNPNFKKKEKIQDTKGGNFGKYDENIGGGGSPNGSSKPSDHGHGVNSDYRKSNNDTMQPRTDDGKFTYKSVNGKSIDPKYGPSRGKTVNPLLTGGENGVMIDEVEKQFKAKSGAYWNKYKDSWYQKGGEKVTLDKSKWKVKVSGDTIWNVAKRRYDSVKGEFEAESSVFDESKSGRRNMEEQAAIQKAQAGNQEEYVTDQNTGGIKLQPSAVVNQVLAQPAPQQGANVGNTPIIPAQPQGQVQQPQAQVKPAPAQPQLQHSAQQIKNLRQQLAASGVPQAKIDALTDAQLDKLWDKLTVK